MGNTIRVSFTGTTSAIPAYRSSFHCGPRVPRPPSLSVRPSLANLRHTFRTRTLGQHRMHIINTERTRAARRGTRSCTLHSNRRTLGNRRVNDRLTSLGAIEKSYARKLSRAVEKSGKDAERGGQLKAASNSLVGNVTCAGPWQSEDQRPS